MNISERIKELEPSLIELRRELHKYPEVGYKEVKTRQIICRELDALGIPYKLMENDAGIIGIVDSGKPGKTVGLRADYDAVEVDEEADVEFRSTNPGMAHACGHDAHTAMLIKAGAVLNECKDQWSGRVLLLFQCAEELGMGWEELLHGIDALGGVNYLAALHIWSLIPEGEILLREKTVFGGSDAFDIFLKGKGGHGARPDMANDPIKAACEVVLKICSIPSNFYSVLTNSVVSVGKIEGGIYSNSIPDTAYVTGTARYFEPGGNVQMKEALTKVAKAAASIYGVEAEVSTRGGVIPVYNDPAAVAEAKKVVPDIEGLKLHMPDDPICAGDDIGILLQKYPGVFAIIGCGNEATGCNIPHHNAKFKIDENVLRKGCEFMVKYSLHCLSL